jgi:hypothetical protein
MYILLKNTISGTKNNLTCIHTWGICYVMLCITSFPILFMGRVNGLYVHMGMNVCITQRYKNNFNTHLKSLLLHYY